MDFPAFGGQFYRSDIHDQTYRCLASNHAGTILSRNIRVRATSQESYEVKMEGRDVFLNNVAFLRCIIPSHVKEYVEVSSWYRGDEILTENADISKYHLCDISRV